MITIITRQPLRRALSALLAGLLAIAPAAVRAESVVTVGMTAGYIPATTGNPDQGFEGFRFVVKTCMTR